VSSGRRDGRAHAPDELYPLLREFMAAAEKWLEKNSLRFPRGAASWNAIRGWRLPARREQFDECYAACMRPCPTTCGSSFLHRPLATDRRRLNRCHSPFFSRRP